MFFGGILTLAALSGRICRFPIAIKMKFNPLFYKNFELDVFITGVKYTIDMFCWWLEYMCCPYSRRDSEDFFFHLSGRYFYWYLDRYSSGGYADAFNHVHTGEEKPEERLTWF